MNKKVARALSIIALVFMVVFATGIVLSFCGVGGWTVYGIVIGSGLVGIGIFLILKFVNKKSDEEGSDTGGQENANNKEPKEPFDDLIEPDQK